MKSEGHGAQDVSVGVPDLDVAVDGFRDPDHLDALVDHFLGQKGGVGVGVVAADHDHEVAACAERIAATGLNVETLVGMAVAHLRTMSGLEALNLGTRQTLTRRALVTGGGRGIGAAISRALADAGAAVAVNYVSNADAARGTVAAIEAGGGRAAIVQGDVTENNDVMRMVAEMEAELGPVDILVNKEPVAALVSSYVPNYDAEVEQLAAENRLPVVGPYTVLQPDGDREGAAESEDNLFTFYLLAGLDLQARALVEAATAKVTPAETRLTIVYPRVRFFDGLAAAAARQAAALGFESVDEEIFELNEFPAQATAVTAALPHQVGKAPLCFRD